MYSGEARQGHVAGKWGRFGRPDGLHCRDCGKMRWCPDNVPAVLKLKRSGRAVWRQVDGNFLPQRSVHDGLTTLYIDNEENACRFDAHSQASSRSRMSGHGRPIRVHLAGPVELAHGVAQVGVVAGEGFLRQHTRCRSQHWCKAQSRQLCSWE